MPTLSPVETLFAGDLFVANRRKVTTIG